MAYRVTNVLDARGQAITTVNPLGYRTTFTQDAVGRQIVLIDANGNATTTTYDAAGRAIAQTNAIGYPTTSIYDPAGQLSAIQDARGSRNSFTYDAAGQQVGRVDPLSRRHTFGYDLAGQRTVRIDARGNATTYTYDPAGQNTGWLYPDSSAATFVYDPLGNRTRMEDSIGIYSYAYDDRRRLKSVEHPSGKIVTYGYDAMEQRDHMIDPGGGIYTYIFDAEHRITLLVNPQSDHTTFSYDAAGRRTVKLLANGTRASFTYDPANQLTSLWNVKSDDSVISSFDYQYDASGNRTSVLEADGARVTWSYDRTYQLTNEHRSGAHAFNTTYVYDPVGNRSIKNEDGGLTTYTYDAASQLENSDDSAGPTNYTFDANGNQQIVIRPGNSRTTYVWDFENHTTQVVLPSNQRITNSYNADGRRVRKEAVTTADFLWDDQHGSYLTVDTDGVTAALTCEPGRRGLLISQLRDGNENYYHFDVEQSTRALTDSLEVVTATALFTLLGVKIASTGATWNRFDYQGEVQSYTDPEVGHVYLPPKFISPEIGRYLSPRYIDNYAFTRTGTRLRGGLVAKPMKVCCFYERFCEVRSIYCVLGAFGVDETWCADQSVVPTGLPNQFSDVCKLPDVFPDNVNAPGFKCTHWKFDKVTLGECDTGWFGTSCNPTTVLTLPDLAMPVFWLGDCKLWLHVDQNGKIDFAPAGDPDDWGIESQAADFLDWLYSDAAPYAGCPADCLALFETCLGQKNAKPFCLAVCARKL